MIHDDTSVSGSELMSNDDNFADGEGWIPNKRIRKSTLDGNVWALCGVENEVLTSYAHSIIQFHEENNELECAYVFKMQMKHAISIGGDAVLTAIDGEVLNIIKKGVWQ
jgi:hypothetical protein